MDKSVITNQGGKDFFLPPCDMSAMLRVCVNSKKRSSFEPILWDEA